jgi:hypothetical protein
MSDFDYFGDAYFDVSVINITSHAYLPRSSKGQLKGSKILFEEKQGNILISVLSLNL